jgi:ribosomal protein S20
MPIIKSAKKRMHQTAKRRARNLTTKRGLRSQIKELMGFIETKDAKKAMDSLNKVQSELDKSVKKNLLKKNTAARKKAQLSAKVKAIGAKPATTKKPASKTATPKKPATKPAAAKKPVAKKTPAKKPASKK